MRSGFVISNPNNTGGCACGGDGGGGCGGGAGMADGVGGGHSVWNKKIDGKSLVELGFDYVLETQNLDFPIN